MRLEYHLRRLKTIKIIFFGLDLLIVGATLITFHTLPRTNRMVWRRKCLLRWKKISGTINLCVEANHDTIKSTSGGAFSQPIQ